MLYEKIKRLKENIRNEHYIASMTKTDVRKKEQDFGSSSEAKEKIIEDR